MVAGFAFALLRAGNYFLGEGDAFAVAFFLMTDVVAFATFFEPSSPVPVVASDISWVAVPSLPLAAFFAPAIVGFALGDAAWADVPTARPRMSVSADTAAIFFFIVAV